jgi:hypothetical protein
MQTYILKLIKIMSVVTATMALAAFLAVGTLTSRPAFAAETEDTSTGKDNALEHTPGDIVEGKVEGKGAGQCKKGYFCLYSGIDWRKGKDDGRNYPLQFSKGSYDLGTYDFRDKASSWINNTGCQVTLSNYRTGLPDPKTTLPPHTRSARMGKWNNAADWAKVC